MGVSTELQKNYTAVLEKISACFAGLAKPYQAQKPRLIAVSKSQPFEKIAELYQLGQRDFGENYAQELTVKAEQAREHGLSEIRWHFIGKFQSNKIGVIQRHCTYVHSIESFSHLELFQKKSPETKIFLSVNIDEETTKSGFHAEELTTAEGRTRVLSGINILGLMCIPDPAHDSRTSFVKMRELATALFQGKPYELSMGMSGDYTVAIEEGSSWVRVGTALFGERNS